MRGAGFDRRPGECESTRAHRYPPPIRPPMRRADSRPPSVMLVELGDSHAEILLPQVLALADAGIPTRLLANRRLLPRLHPRIGGRIRVEAVDCDGPVARRRSAWRVRRRIRAAQVSHVVVNTAAGSAVRSLARALPRDVRVTGILHDVARLWRSSRQLSISRRIRRYLVLARHLVPAAPDGADLGAPGGTDLSGLAFGSFYPIRTPDDTVPETRPGRPHLDVATATPGNPTPPGAPTPLKVVVPGNVSYRRRSYRRLPELIRAAGRDGRPGLRVEILGDITRGDGPELRGRLEEAGVADRVVVHEGFVPEPAFADAVARADAVLPLLPPPDGIGATYLRHRVSGSFNLAYAHRTPLLVDARWRVHPDLALVGVFYGDGAAGPTLPDPGALDAALARARANYRTRRRFDPDVQSRRYLDFVLGEGRSG